jgi:hypothetical protein
LGICPECLEEVDEDEAHETVDGRFTHRDCLPICDNCHDVLLHDLCKGGFVLVGPGPLLHWLTEMKSQRRFPVHDATFSGRFCGPCFPLVFFPPQGDE